MYAAVRLRGEVDARDKAQTTMEHLGLEQKNHVVLLPETPSYEGMLQRAKDYITYGTIDADYATDLLEEHVETDGDLDETLDRLGYDSIGDLVDDIEDGTVSLGQLRDEGFRNVLRLNPPTKGYRDTRRHHTQGGALGDRETAITELLDRMR